MSEEENVLKLILEELTNVNKEVFDATKNIEIFLKKLKCNKNAKVRAILEKTKTIVDNFYEHSVTVKEKFYKQYNIIESISNEKNESSESDNEENTASNKTLDTNAKILENETNALDISTQEDGEPIVDTDNIEENDNTDISVQKGGEQTVKVGANHNKNNMKDKDIDVSNLDYPLQSPETLNSSVKDKENKKVAEDTNNTLEDNKQMIRLVDLSKLMDPKKKSVTFDSSVIILTSSDEESRTPKKIGEEKDENSYLKSALKQTLTDKFNDKELQRIENKFNGSKINRKDESISQNSDSDVPISNLEKRRSKQKVDVNPNEMSSDSDVEETQEKRRKLKEKREKSQKTIHKSESDEELSETEYKNNSLNDNLRVRKSSRLQTNEISKQAHKKCLQKLFDRKLGKSDISEKIEESRRESSNESATAIKKIQYKKNKNLVEEHLSDPSNSSSSEAEPIVTKNKSSAERSRNIKKAYDTVNEISKNLDEKFKCEVYIPLPKINCDRLKEIYLKNKDIFEIRRLANLNLKKSCKRTHKAIDVDKDKKLSSGGEKPKNKKSKNIVSENESTSKDEHLPKITDSINKNTNNDVNGDHQISQTENDKDQLMANIALEELQSNDDGNKSQSDNSESEVEELNKNKNEKKKDAEDIEKSDGAEQKKEESDEKEKVTENDIDKQKCEDPKEIIEEDKKDNEDSSSSDGEGKLNKKSWRKDKLLTSKIDSTDSEEELEKIRKRKNNSGDETRKVKKRVRKAIVLSDSDESEKDKNQESDDSSQSDSSKENSEDESDKKEKPKKPTRKRIKRTNDSSSSDEDKSTRKQIRKLIGRDSLSETTKKAEAEEKERKARIAEKQKKYNSLMEAVTDSQVENVVLDYDEKEKKELLTVDKKIVKKLKPHQASGIRFMWDACFESIERTKKTKGSGCILAHCMGLGKTLQVIALSHTLLTNVKATGVHKILVVCPLNTVLNWKSEFKKWMPKNSDVEVYELVSCKQNYERQYIVTEWHTDGGVLIIGYNMFRTLSNPDNKRISKKMRTALIEGLVDPGPDLVVCDEGHLLKNEKTNLSIAMNRIKTLRRIVLTGTPLQNNLKEYWCMVQFIKPNLLGTYKEYLNRFVNPITNGQYTDSTQRDIILMRKRSHVLHKLLDGVVQRRDYAVLEPYLPPKHEFVLFIRLTETQVKIYKHYMDRFARQNDGTNRTSFLFADFQAFQRICTHPRLLLSWAKEKKEKEFDEESEGSLKDFIDDGDDSDEESSKNSSSGSNSDSDVSDKKSNESKSKPKKTRLTRAQAAQRKEKGMDSDSEPEEVKKEWFQDYCDGEELDNINHSGKLFLLFQILKECEEIGDKILVFSQSLYTLNCIEYFLEKIDEATQNGTPEKVGGHTGSWSIGLDYFRLDGTSSCDNRATWCNLFNNPNNTRARLFLISTKAGGLGINLVAANRVIIFDVSWNPSHDVQSIYRVYRFGQTKPCYIYRFVTYGAMEMKIYERQVTKQAISKRVIDEQQIDRHYNQNDLQELYKCDLEPTDRPIPMVPKDVLLGEMLQKYEKTIYKYHLHQSLLENKTDEGLNEAERKAAWEEFENEKVLRKNTGFGGLDTASNTRVNAQSIEIALANMVKKDNPTWSDVQVRGIIPALVQQLQVQLAEGDMTMYARVQQEIQLMQEIQAQKLREAYYQQQVMRMIQRQQEQAKLLGNLYVDPSRLGGIPGSGLNNVFSVNMAQGGPSRAPRTSNDIIELND